MLESPSSPPGPAALWGQDRTAQILLQTVGLTEGEEGGVVGMWDPGSPRPVSGAVAGGLCRTSPEQEVSLPGMQQYYVSWAKVQRKLMNT